MLSIVFLLSSNFVAGVLADPDSVIIVSDLIKSSDVIEVVKKWFTIDENEYV